MSPHHSGRLTSTDASFLYLERKEAPMHIGALCLFDGEVPYEGYLAHLESKLVRLPRFRERTVATPYHLGHPTWETDPDFDVRRHVQLHRLPPPGGEAELRQQVNRLLEGMLDRSRPLWELHLIHGLEGGRSAMVSKVHHAMVDGVGGNALLLTILDLEPDPPPPDAEDTYVATEPPDRRQRIAEALWDASRARIDAWSGYLRALTDIGRNLDSERLQSVLSVLGETAPDLLRPPRRLPFNRRCTGERNFYWTRLSFAEARAIRAALGGTVNDVMLTALGGAVGRYARHHGVATGRRTMRVMVPVNVRPRAAVKVRPRDAGADLGNLVSVLPVQVPLGIDDPLRRLRVVRGTTRTLKEGRVAEGVSLMANLSGAVPAPLQAALGAIAVSPFPIFNLVCTNVPGPQIPLYAEGHRLEAYYPYVPVGFSMGVGCAIFSYDQQLFIGLNSDRRACPDVDRLCRFLDESFAEMKKLAGVADHSPVELRSGKRPRRVAAKKAPPRARRRTAGRRSSRKKGASVAS